MVDFVSAVIPHMRFYDVFNGDADGICALIQLRLATARDATLVTGVKRDIRLLGRVVAGPGDDITVLDISLDVNRESLDKALAAGARVRWFDHHHPGQIPGHPALEVHIDTAADVCTSLIVDRHLRGRFRKWAVVAAFGDNLERSALTVAAEAGISGAALALLQELGVCMNYNAYGESVEDLLFAPAQLYLSARRFEDPLEFVRQTQELDRLRDGMRDDLARAAAVPVQTLGDGARVLALPNAPWARRVVGVQANALARERPGLAHAVLVKRADGAWLVSLRAPLAEPRGAVGLARRFASGGGREGAAGIDALPDGEVERFLGALREAYPTPR